VAIITGWEILALPLTGKPARTGCSEASAALCRLRIANASAIAASPRRSPRNTHCTVKKSMRKSSQKEALRLQRVRIARVSVQGSLVVCTHPPSKRPLRRMRTPRACHRSPSVALWRPTDPNQTDKHVRTLGMRECVANPGAPPRPGMMSRHHRSCGPPCSHRYQINRDLRIPILPSSMA
jgi:hypothetical protein